VTASRCTDEKKGKTNVSIRLVDAKHDAAEKRRTKHDAEEGKAVIKPDDNARTAPPPGWASDELTQFLDIARQNQWTTFRNKPAVKTLVAIDALFAIVCKDWLNPRSEIGSLLFHRCHAAFRTAVALSMAGQTADINVHCRLALENAAYAVHVFREPKLGAVWLNRHESPASLAAQKKAFQFKVVKESVKGANARAGQRLAVLYQRVVEMDAYPNETYGKRMPLAILREDGPELDLALNTVTQCGMVSLELLQIVFGARFELLGVGAGMLQLRSGL
jgi:hypothetical protein